MELFLCKVKHTFNGNYSIDNFEIDDDSYNSGKRMLWPKRFKILDCKIKMSIFSPLTLEVKVDYDGDKSHLGSPWNAPEFLPFYTTYGLGMLDDIQLDGWAKKNIIPTDKTRPASAVRGEPNDFEENVDLYNENSPYYFANFVNDHNRNYLTINYIEEANRNILEVPYCVISNRPNNFVPFVVVKSKAVSNKGSVSYFLLTLIEKRSLSLALCHKFDCLSPKTSADDNNNKNTANGLLSIPEIIERLSVIPEDEDKSITDASINNIVSFESAGINRDIDKGTIYPDEQTEHCAFLSRFIAPASQSRLSIIYSLARKYGYGLVYRPRSKQYYAIDLLSSTAPGHPTGKPTPYIFDDVWTFDDEDDKYYYGEYSLNPSNSLTSMQKLKNYPESRNSVPERKTDPNFDNFFYYRLISGCRYFNLNMSVGGNYIFSLSGDYQYLSRYSSLSSATDYDRLCPKGGKPSFGITSLTPNLRADFRKYKKSLNCDHQVNYSAFLQEKVHTWTEGGSKFFYEDEVNLDSKAPDKANSCYTISGDLKTVNDRLNYAKYKLDYMKNCKKTLYFEFYDKDTRLSHITNYVYETLSRLGYYTTIFSTVYFNSEFIVRRRGQTSSCGSTHYILESYYEKLLNFNRAWPQGKRRMLENLYYGLCNSSNPYDANGSIFGEVTIELNNLCYNDENGQKRSARFTQSLAEYCTDDDYGNSRKAKERIVSYSYSIKTFISFYPNTTSYDFSPAGREVNALKEEEDEEEDIDTSTPVESKIRDIIAPKKPLKPFAMQRASNIRKTDNTIEFDYLNVHYSCGKTILGVLCKFILDHTYLNKDLQNQRADISLVKRSDDPILVVKTYMKYKRYIDFTNQVSDINRCIELQDFAEMALADPTLKKYYDVGPKGQRYYYREDSVKKIKDDAKENLERLSKTQAALHGGFERMQNGLWRKMTTFEIERMGSNHFSSVKDFEKINDKDIVNEFKSLRDRNYIYKATGLSLDDYMLYGRQ